MIKRIKNKLKRIVKRILGIQNVGTYEEKDFLEMLYESEILSPLDNLVPERKVLKLNWNGPVMYIEGYIYLNGIAADHDDAVRKRLLLISDNLTKTYLPLDDVKLDQLSGDTRGIDKKYAWSGFKGEYNFSRISKNNMPLSAGNYQVFIEIEVNEKGKKVYRKITSLGNIESFFNEGFHSTKMEYFSSRKALKFNLLVRYNKITKTLELSSNKLKDFDPVLMGMVEKNKDGFLYRFNHKYLFKIVYNFYKLYPIQKDKIVFASESRHELSGNMKFVYDKMVENNLHFDYKFFLKKSLNERRNFGELMNLAYHLATARVILLDDFYPLIYPLKIRKNAELVQLWHAVGAFKTFGFSRIGLPGGPNPASKNHRNYTKAVVSSKNVAKHYAEGFGIDIANVIATGIPRTDVFFDDVYIHYKKEELYDQYPFLRNKKVIMFAPTFRGNGQQSAHYNMEMLKLDKLYEALHEEYVFLFKIHPFVKNDFSIPYQYSDFFYDFSEYREINDLLFITDILITDYSSVCFEFALLKKPMLFFAYDVESYIQARDFYYEYKSFIPGPLVKTTEKMIETIKNKDFEIEKIDKFIDYFFEDTDGQSTQRVIDRIILEQEDEIED